MRTKGAGGLYLSPPLLTSPTARPTLLMNIHGAVSNSYDTPRDSLLTRRSRAMAVEVHPTGGAAQNLPSSSRNTWKHYQTIYRHGATQ